MLRERIQKNLAKTSPGPKNAEKAAQAAPAAEHGNVPELSFSRWLSLVVGLSLASLPFVHFMHGDHHGASSVHASTHASTARHERSAHSDHDSRYGGQLGMSGDHHVELVESGDSLRVYVSDAFREPLEADSGSATFDTGRVEPLSRFMESLIAPVDAEATEVSLSIELAQGGTVAIDFALLKPEED